MRRHPLVWAVVLNWNALDLTVRCLESLLDSDYLDLRILVVDNASDRDPTSAIRSLSEGIEVIRLAANLGYGGGNNAGIELAKSRGADYILVANNDTVAAPEMIGKLVEFAEGRPSAGLVGPLLLCLDDRKTLYAAGSNIDWANGSTRHRGLFQPVESYKDLKNPIRVDFVSGCCILVRSELVGMAGALRAEYYLNYEDVEWAVRAGSHGFECWLVPTAHMWHKVSATLVQGSPKDTYYSTRNSLKFFKDNGPRQTRWIAIARIVARTARTVSAWSIRREYRQNGYRSRRAANLYALRDFVLGRDGKMGEDVARAIGDA